MFNLQTVIIGLIFLLAFVSVVAAGLPFVQRDTFASRLKAVAARREELSAKQREAFAQRARFQPKRHVSAMKAVLDRLKLQNLIQSKELRAQLAQAGWRAQSAAVTFVFSRIASPILLTVLALVALSLHPALIKYSFNTKLMICALAMVVGTYLPNLLLKNTIQKRQKILARGFPDALDLMVICVEAGLSVEGAFSRVTDEMAEANPEIAEEIGLTSAELAFLGDRRQAYENLAERTGLPAIKSLATALMQSERYGTPVSVALRVLSQEQRDSRMAAAEKKAAALPAQLTVPMIVFFLPVLFFVIIGPAVIRTTRQIGGG